MEFSKVEFSEKVDSLIVAMRCNLCSSSAKLKKNLFSKLFEFAESQLLEMIVNVNR